ncbi:hypothetical protein B0H14DRAFT_2555203 [Mycena olivaceomarginata]|nr:hypothetical protein B0H14DRAFT_2555203 [Mycena olivaceomarginata]
MSRNSPTNSDSDDANSPKKAIRTGERDDATGHLPELRSDRERASPAQRKISGSGSVRRTAPGPDGIPPNTFLAAAGPSAHSYTLGEVPSPDRAYLEERAGRSRGRMSVSPTPSRRSATDLDTGHHATDVESAGDAEDEREEDVTMNPAPALGPAADAPEHMAVDNAGPPFAADAVAPAHAPAQVPAAHNIAQAPALDGERVEMGFGHPFIFANAAQANAHNEPPPPPSAAAASICPPPAASSPGAHMGAQFQAPALANFAPAAGANDAVAAGPNARAPPAAANAAADAAAAAGIAEEPFQGFPPLAAHAAAAPTDAHLNPHRLAPAAPADDPTGPADVGKVAKMQPNTGHFPFLVISQEWVEANVHEEHRRLVRENPDQYVYAVGYNMGRHFGEKLKDQMVPALEDAISNHVNPDTTVVFRVKVADESLIAMYDGPITLLIHVLAPLDRARLLRQHTGPANGTFAWTFLGPEQLQLSWAALIVKSSVGGGTEGAKLALRGSVSEFIWKNAKIGRLIEQYTAHLDQSPLDQRRLNLSKSIECRWDDSMKAFVVYIKPCTTNAAHWLEITNALSDEELCSGYYIFTPMKSKTPFPGPRCVTCKHDTHFEFGCAVIRDSLWWGPKGQIRDIKDGPLATASGLGRGRNATRGGRGGGNSGGRGGNRGRGSCGRGRGGN